MLHCLSQIPNAELLLQYLDIINLQPKAALLLYQDSVYLAMTSSKYAPQLITLADQQQLYVLAEDQLARGLRDKLIKQAIIITNLDFVELTSKHDKVISW